MVKELTVMQIPSALLVSLLVLPVPAASARQSDAPRMVTYYLVLLRSTHKAGSAPPMDAETRTAHLAHLEKLQREEYLLAAGPFGDGGDAMGVVMLKAASEDEARTLEEADPLVKGRSATMEVIPFMAPDGWFKEPLHPREPDHLFFGFLVNGADRSQDAATAAQLQKQHLAYMEGQAAAGRLVLAGPIATREGTRRGIIAYRAASLAEARRLAEGDPMVKAGRLAVDLHPWMTWKGVLR